VSPQDNARDSGTSRADSSRRLFQADKPAPNWVQMILRDVDIYPPKSWAKNVLLQPASRRLNGGGSPGEDRWDSRPARMPPSVQ
jgi:hypothetical protein